MIRSFGARKTPANLSEWAHQRLDMYALAAGAAGVGLLALAAPAEGRIIYTPTHRTIKTHDILHLDLNHDRIDDFLISNHSFCTDICGRTLRALPVASKNQVVGAKGIGGAFYAYALKRGAKIGPRQPFSGKLMAASGSEYGNVGEWFNVSDRYLGLKFVINGKIHYGWARLSVIAGSGTITAALTGSAYETIPGKSIKAGRRHSMADDPTNDGFGLGASLTAPIPDKPQPVSLGMLALGAQGVPMWRRKESVLEAELKGAK
jgi:hypothetical protein